MSALDGLTILDFSPLLPGPWATEQLRQLGARVIRIESPEHPDMLRAYSSVFKAINSSKESWQLNLKTPEAVAQIKEKLGEIDIVIEQFRPGVMRKLGLDYDTLQSLKPELIYCSITGYGQNGTWADKAGHDINYQAVSGLASYGGSTQPSLTSAQIADIAGGSYPAMVAVLSAVIERQRTGKGQYIDVAMADGAMALNSFALPQVMNDEPSPLPQTTQLNGGGFYDFYACKDGRHVAFGGLEPKFFSAFCQAIGKPDWVARFADLSASSQQHLKADLRAMFLTKTQQQWLACITVDCCFSAVLTVDEALKQTHFQQRGWRSDSHSENRPLTLPYKLHGRQR